MIFFLFAQLAPLVAAFSSWPFWHLRLAPRRKPLGLEVGLSLADHSRIRLHDLHSCKSRTMGKCSEVLTGRSLSGMSHIVPGAVDSEDASSSESAQFHFFMTSPNPVACNFLTTDPLPHCGASLCWEEDDTSSKWSKIQSQHIEGYSSVSEIFDPNQRHVLFLRGFQNPSSHHFQSPTLRKQSASMPHAVAKPCVKAVPSQSTPKLYQVVTSLFCSEFQDGMGSSFKTTLADCSGKVVPLFRPIIVSKAASPMFHMRTFCTSFIRRTRYRGCNRTLKPSSGSLTASEGNKSMT